MPAFRNPDLPPGPLKAFIDAMHELHLAAGHPSARILEDDLGSSAVSHTTIHKVFAAGSLPSWGVVEVLSEAMAGRARRDKQKEVERIRVLWMQAAGVKEKLTMQSQRPSQSNIPGRTLLISEIMPKALDEIEAMGSKQKIRDFRVPTGFDDLDALTGGWPVGGLIIIGGRPSSGKTSLMLNFARAASISYRLPSMFISVEENSQEIQFRILSSLARIPLHALRTGCMSDEDWSRLARQMVSIRDTPLAINSSSHLSAEEICTEAARLAVSMKLRAIFIDGTPSLIKSLRGDYETQIESALQKLKALAFEFKMSVVVSLSASRPKEMYEKVEVRNLAASEVIERIADVIIMLNREDQDDLESPRAGEADLRVAKNRYGPQATITVAYQAHYSRFVDILPSEHPVFPNETSRIVTEAAEQTSSPSESADTSPSTP